MRTRTAFGRIRGPREQRRVYRAALLLDITEEHWDPIMNVECPGGLLPQPGGAADRSS
jgi:hypothetical protein